MDGKFSVLLPGGDRNESLMVSSSSLDSIIANELQKNIHPNHILTVKENLDAAVKGDSIWLWILYPYLYFV